jgi:hypothetical protein
VDAWCTSSEETDPVAAMVSAAAQIANIMAIYWQKNRKNRLFFVLTPIKVRTYTTIHSKFLNIAKKINPWHQYS